MNNWVTSHIILRAECQILHTAVKPLVTNQSPLFSHKFSFCRIAFHCGFLSTHTLCIILFLWASVLHAKIHLIKLLLSSNDYKDYVISIIVLLKQNFFLKILKASCANRVVAPPLYRNTIYIIHLQTEALSSSEMWVSIRQMSHTRIQLFSAQLVPRT